MGDSKQPCLGQQTLRHLCPQQPPSWKSQGLTYHGQPVDFNSTQLDTSSFLLQETVSPGDNNLFLLWTHIDFQPGVGCSAVHHSSLAASQFPQHHGITHALPGKAVTRTASSL